jgi:transposase
LRRTQYWAPIDKQHSSAGKDRLSHISKQGDRYLRSLFVAGALAVIRYAKIHRTKHRPWLTAILARLGRPQIEFTIERTRALDQYFDHSQAFSAFPSFE